MKKICFLLMAFFCLFGSMRAAEVVPEKLTPLVGKNCVINQIDKSLVDAVGMESALANLLDSNTDNYASLSGLAGIDVAYHQIISIKDIANDYSGKDLEAGFVIQSVSDGTNLLTADVLKMFVVETYLDGEKQESSVMEGTESGLLDLNLITIASDGKTKVSIRTTKPFDEVCLAVAGVNVEAFKQMRLYYAFVGANELKPITQTLHYPNASVHGHRTNGLASEWTSAMWNWPNQKEKLVGKNSESDGVGFGLVSGLLTDPHVTINAGETIPANTEIGFLVESGSVLAIELFNNTVLTTYDENDNEVESKKIVSVLGLSALSGGKSTVSMVTSKPCQQIKIKFGGLNIDLGGTKIYYAYTRSADVDVDDDCDLKLSADVAVCSQNSYQLSGVDGIKWSIISQPDGANATVSSTGLVENMTVQGEYIIQAEKGNCMDQVIINNKPTGISYECNRPIVGNGVEPFTPKGGGCLLCISPDLDPDKAFNVVDEDLTNYIEYTKGLDLLSNTSIYGVQSPTIYEASEENPRRVGFVMQATDQFLSADLLKFFVIKTYLNGELQESSPVDENDAVTADLIGNKDNQMRFSFVATKPFNQVSIWTAGILSLNISKYRIYYAFEEPATSTCLSQFSSAACLTMLSATQHGASINYGRTGFGGVANVGATMRNLSNVIDGDMTTSAYIGKVAGVAANTSLSIKTNRIFEHGYQAGFVIKEQTFVGNVDLLRGLRIRTYLNGVATGDEDIVPEVLSLDLIGGSGKSLITVTPTKPFDEIQLDMGGLVDALVELQVFGAFVQSDTDGDGTPDCLDKNPCGTQLVVLDADVPCGATHAEIEIAGCDPEKQYTLFDGKNEYVFIDGKVSFDITPGYYNCTIREEGIDVYQNLIIEVHPDYTIWKGTNSSDWNDWGNWSNGVPGACTNVLIPSKDSLDTSNGIHYPILERGIGIYECDGIYLKPGAELVNQNLLTYNKAWVALNIYPERVNMVSVPLKESFSGDFFAYKKSGSKEPLQQDYKNPLLGDTLIGNVNRSVPFIITSIWEDGWKQIRTILDHKINTAEGIAVNSVKNQYVNTSEPLEIIFGKEDSLYKKVNNAGIELSGTIVIPRDMSKVGKFTYDADTLQSTITGKAEQTRYLLGNPFVSHLNVAAFLSNSHNSSVLKPFIKVNNNMAGNLEVDYEKLTEISANDLSAKVALTQSFFVEALQPTKELTIVFTPDMMTTGDYMEQQPAPQTKSKASGSTGISLSNIKAYAKDGEAVISASETIRSVQIVTAAGQVLASKQPNSTEVRMPLGQGMNIVKVQTENDVQTFKLMNN